MKIGLISSMVPLVYGGGRNIVDWLQEKLQERGEQSEIVYLPTTYDADTILEQMVAFRLLQLEDSYDRVITFRPPAHAVRHPQKVVWFIHHIRQFYDLWNTPYCPVPDTAPWRALRATLVHADTKVLSEARRVFTNSRIVSDRLKTFNDIDSEVVYPPVLRPELFRAGDYGDEIVCVCRMEHHKRQHLLVEAMSHSSSGVRLRLCGESLSPDYMRSLHQLIEQEQLGDRVLIEDRWVSEEEKAERLSTALATAYVPFDEDSYGYCTIEAAHARRCTVTLTDAGGVLEFVIHGVNGYVVAPDPRAIADVFDRLYVNRTLAREMGESAQQRLDDLGINWDSTVTRLLS
jgi:glycosyltransferase involved in cell wall biosynthesis